MAARYVFSSGEGRAVRLPDHRFSDNDIGLIRFQDLTDRVLGIVVSRLQDRLRPHYQLTHTLSNEDLLYTYGRTLDRRTISGLCYEGMCDRNSANSSGYRDLKAFFEEMNVGVNPVPMTIFVGRSDASEAYLFEMSISLQDPAARVWQFDAVLGVIPPRSRPATVTAPATGDVGSNFPDGDAGTVVSGDGGSPPTASGDPSVPGVQPGTVVGALTTAGSLSVNPFATS